MKKTTLIIIIVCAVVLVTAIVATSLAIWIPRPSTDDEEEIPTEQVNPSAKHIKYVALDENGNVTLGSAEAYACVGYDGLVEELNIPSSYNDKPVTKILIDTENYADARFSGSPVVTRIIIPKSVTFIAAGVFANIPNLKKVTIKGDGNISIGDGAFAGCVSLEVFDCDRSVAGNRASYLFGTPLA